MGKIQSAIGFAALSASGVAAAVLSMPTTAMALGWKANDMIQNTSGATGMNAASINKETLATWVQNFTTWILGIAIVLFVLKVVLTAVDRLVFDSQGDGKGGTRKNLENGKGNGGGVLCQIPLIGAYDPSMAWKDIFIHFGKNLAIVAGAWVIVQIVTGVILFVFDALTKQG